MVDDILLKRRNMNKDQTVILNDKQLQFYALAEIDDLLRSIGKSRLWNICKIFVLTKNMRLNVGHSDNEVQELIKFAQWVLDIGDGKVHPPTNLISEVQEDDVLIPPEFCDLNNENSVENMITSTYPDFIQNCKNPKYLSERAILTPTNQTVGHLNALIVEKLPGSPTNITQNVVYKEVFYALPRS
ncbi:hypothetical protein POM88_051486 [Heracleum sosnowskyi]|uniref:ATP-dependent DNA helicase n=1 Tax=Heracleum sosnowskyi TaxID=360622 RepID=A0AAD8M1B1_9APIA|nr:hypothetical protein POM88_051486 [Heracleum sosnowskyi]